MKKPKNKVTKKVPKLNKEPKVPDFKKIKSSKK